MKIFILVSSRDVHVLNDLSANGLYNMSANGMNVISIRVRPLDIYSLNGLSINGINVPSVHVRPCDVGESGDITPESGVHGLNDLNGLGLESTLNGLNSLNCLVL